MVHAGGSFDPGWRFLPIFFSNDFYFSFLGLMCFSDIVILRGRPIVIANKTVSVLICPIILRFVYIKE